MISLKFKIIKRFYNLFNDVRLNNRTDLCTPYIIFGFSEKVKVKNDQREIRIDIDDTNSYQLDGFVEEPDYETCCMKMILCHPQLETDNDPTYQRVSEIFVEYCILMKETTYPIVCTNKLGETIAEFNLVVSGVQIQQPDQLDNKWDARLFENLSYQNQRNSEINGQQIYEEKMASFLEKYFKNKWKGTKNMLFFNDDFDFDGRIPFYPFCDIQIPMTNSRYWVKVFNYVLYLKHGAESDRTLGLDDYYESLNLRERLSLAMDMKTIVAASSYYLFDVVQETGLDRKRITSIEDFCPIMYTWSGDCEDFTAFIQNSEKVFQNCDFGKDDSQKEIKYLIELQRLSHYFIIHSCLCVADRASTNSTVSDLTLHMCTLLIKKNFIKNNTNPSMFENKQDFETFLGCFDSKDHPEYIVINGKNERIPSFMIGEGTGFVKPFPTQPVKSHVKEFLRKESVKERLYISSQNIQFYKYALVAITNYYMDSKIPLNVQSFMITYKKKENQTVNPDFDSNSYIYGVDFNDLFENEEKLEFVPTPKYDEKLIHVTKRLSKMKFAFPPFYVNEDNTFLSKYKIDNVSPVVSRREMLGIIERHKDEIKNSPFTSKDAKSQYIIVPPRVFESVYKNLPRKSIQRINIFQYQADFFVIIIWITKEIRN